MTIDDMIKKYSLNKHVDCWQLPQNKDVWIISHDACEKIASIEDIRLTDIQVLNSDWDFCRMIVTMKKENLFIKSIGEAILRVKNSDKIGNCNSPYVGCMAEKRGIDRCILKLINAYQYGVYSDVESEEFEKKNCNVEDKRIDEANKQLDSVIKDDMFENDCNKFLIMFGQNIEATDVEDYQLVKSRNLDRETLNKIIHKFVTKYKK